MKKLFITASALCLLLSARAQFTYDYLKAADGYYHKADYYSAAQYYEKYLTANGKNPGTEYDPYVVKGKTEKKEKVSGKEQAVYNLAESYRQLNYYVKAEPWYQQAVAYDAAKFPLAEYNYATTLRALGKFEEAEKAFKTFLTNYTTPDKYTEAAQREIKNLDYIQAQMKKKDLKEYTIRASDAFASEGANYAPVWASDNTVYFTTTRPDSTSSKKQYLNKVYEATYADGSFANLTKLPVTQPSELHQGGVALSADGNTMYVTRWSVGDGPQTAQILSSQKTASGWSEPTPLNAIVNVTGANNKQPFVMPDGRLLFASDRPGGLGGYDLYVADMAGGQPTAVASLGTTINTSFDEEAPYYHAQSNTLVFATNGRVGMGGFDLFFSKEKGGVFAEPENFGYPVNSIKNEMYFASHSRNILQDVLLSSDRSNECCLQLYSLSRVKKPKRIAGVVLDCKTNAALSGASIVVKDAAAGKTVFSGSTTASGSYGFQLDEFAPLQITAKLSGYTPGGVQQAVPADEETESLNATEICLNKIPEVGTVEVLDNVYFEYNKSLILDESFSSLDKLVKTLADNPSVSIEISGHTDNVGNDKYNQKLSEERAQSVVAYLVAKGIDASRLIAKGYGKSKPIAPNTASDGTDYPEGRAKNRRTEFKVIKN